MPLPSPVIDDRRFQQLVDDTLARARVHTPEWTNFTQSDPGVTLVQLFSFLTESLLYRANLIPERNHNAFLKLLRMPLAPASAAQGLVSINNERGAPNTQTLPADLEVRAQAVSFRTQLGLDVLPVEARVFFKRSFVAPTELLDYYRLLYASYGTQFPKDVKLYETVTLDPAVVDQVDLNKDTVDRSLWIALLARKNDVAATTGDPWKSLRDELGGRTLTLGVVPALDAISATLTPGGGSQPRDLLVFEVPRILPRIADGERLPRDANGRPAPTYLQLEPHTEIDLLTGPGVVQLALPEAAQLKMWSGVDPLEAGVGDMTPTLEDSALADKLLTWLRIRSNASAQARIKWAGINVVPVLQSERVIAEPLVSGDGTPDQVRQLSRAPVLRGSVEVVTRAGTDAPLSWKEIDDLAAASPEVAVTDPRVAPGVSPPPSDPDRVNVFELDPEAGVLGFGDGLRGRRLPLGASAFASYQFCQGAAGNVGESAINGAPQLPSGFAVSNPVRTWGGADAETVSD